MKGVVYTAALGLLLSVCPMKASGLENIVDARTGEIIPRTEESDKEANNIYASVRFHSRNHPALLVVKNERKAYLLSDAREDTLFTVGLSEIPVGRKMKEGDLRIPEGLYRVKWKRDGTKGNESRFELAFLLDFPNAADKARCIKGTKSGDLIEIHQGSDSTDWTDGCIAIRQEGMQYLMQYLKTGCVVGIVPYRP